MKKFRFLLYAIVGLNFVGLNAQQNLSSLSWNKVANSMPAEWYATDQAVQIADTVVAYQTAIGGWTKNTSNPQLSSSASFLRLNVLSSLN